MRLVYESTGKPVQVGDKVTLDGELLIVDYFRPPHKPNSEGKVTLVGKSKFGYEYYVSVIGAKWVERDDRGEPMKVDRKLTADEVEALAWFLTVSNLGHGGFSGANGSRVVIHCGGTDTVFDVSEPSRMKQACHGYLQSIAESDEMWADFEEEYTEWKAELKSAKLSSIAATYGADLAPMMAAFGRYAL